MATSKKTKRTEAQRNNGIPIRRSRGRRLGEDLAPAAKLIFSRIGQADCPVKHQRDLRKKSKVGSSYLQLLRDKPEQVPKEMLIRLAQAVNANLGEVLKAAGYAVGPQELPKTIDFPPAYFFKTLGERTDTFFLLAVSFNDRPLAEESPAVQKMLINLINDSRMCFAILVPSNDGGTTGGALAARYAVALEHAFRFAKYLVSKCGADKKKQIGFFRLAKSLGAECQRIVLPPVGYDERSCLVAFDKPDSPIKERIVASWLRDRFKEHDEGIFRVVHDPQPPDEQPCQDLIAKQWEDYFQDVIESWKNAKHCGFGSVPNSIWERVSLD